MKRRMHPTGVTESVCLGSRAEGLRTGTLHDISPTARACAQLDLPTAITRRLWEAVAPGEPFRANDERVKEVCYALAFARVGAMGSELYDEASGQAMRFEFLHRAKPLTVTAVVHPAEDLTLVCTIMLSHED
jgi:hypothetical protein